MKLIEFKYIPFFYLINIYCVLHYIKKNAARRNGSSALTIMFHFNFKLWLYFWYFPLPKRRRHILMYPKYFFAENWSTRFLLRKSPIGFPVCEKDAVRKIRAFHTTPANLLCKFSLHIFLTAKSDIWPTERRVAFTCEKTALI